MKKQIKKTVLFSLFLSSVLAFKVGDQVELESYLNARSSAQFLKTSGNIKTQLSAGTKGEVLESKKMNSGNYGIKMKVNSGAHRGESYWLYYNLKDPKMKLFDSQRREQKTEQITQEKLQIKSAELTEDQTGIRAPEEAAVLVAANTAKFVLENKTASQVTSPPTGSDCAPAVSAISSNVSEEDYTESDIVEPFREASDSRLHSTTCRTMQGGWDQCRHSDSKKIEAFQLTNKGPNNIVKSNEYYINRTMSFEFDDRARSEMKLVVVDSPDDTTSHSTYSIMLFFPRTVLPAIKKEGDELIVTLPNKEIVRYNAKTKEVLGGVFSEGAMVADPKNKNKARPADIKYTGNGVMIRSDKSGDLPYGDIELSNGSKAPSSSTATISKKGFKDCKIPSKDIWYTDYQKGGSVFIKPEFQADKGMDDFIKKKCGFSLY